MHVRESSHDVSMCLPLAKRVADRSRTAAMHAGRPDSAAQAYARAAAFGHLVSMACCAHAHMWKYLLLPLHTKRLLLETTTDATMSRQHFYWKVAKAQARQGTRSCGASQKGKAVTQILKASHGLYH